MTGGQHQAFAGTTAVCKDARDETFWLWLVRPDRRIAASFCLTGGGDHVVLPLDGIAERIARAAAPYLFVAHVHPSGDVRPSAADIETTRRLWRMARLLGVSLQDHCILSGQHRFSFRDNGLL